MATKSSYIFAVVSIHNMKSYLPRKIRLPIKLCKWGHFERANHIIKMLQVPGSDTMIKPGKDFSKEEL